MLRSVVSETNRELIGKPESRVADLLARRQRSRRLVRGLVRVVSLRVLIPFGASFDLVHLAWLVERAKKVLARTDEN